MTKIVPHFQSNFQYFIENFQAHEDHFWSKSIWGQFEIQIFFLEFISGQAQLLVAPLLLSLTAIRVCSSDAHPAVPTRQFPLSPRPTCEPRLSLVFHARVARHCSVSHARHYSTLHSTPRSPLLLPGLLPPPPHLPIRHVWVSVERWTSPPPLPLSRTHWVMLLPL
jgi:hypothetical protein